MNVRNVPVISLLFLIFLSGILNAEVPADESWRKAFAFQQEGKYEAAAAEWQHAILLSKQAGKTASHAHWNLGLCCVQLQLPDCTSYHWLESLKESPSLSHTTQVTQSLGQLQNSLGLANNVTRSFGFIIATHIGENTAMVSWSLAFWFFIAFLIRWGRSRNMPRFPWFVATLFATLIGVFAYLAGQRLDLYHSIGTQENDVPVFASFDGTTQIATLPAGAIVLAEGEKNGFQKITEPIPGWIAIDRFSKPFSETRDSLRATEHSAAH